MGFRDDLDMASITDTSQFSTQDRQLYGNYHTQSHTPKLTDTGHKRMSIKKEIIGRSNQSSVQIYSLQRNDEKSSKTPRMTITKKKEPVQVAVWKEKKTIDLNNDGCSKHSTKHKAGIYEYRKTCRTCKEMETLNVEVTSTKSKYKADSLMTTPNT